MKTNREVRASADGTITILETRVATARVRTKAQRLLVQRLLDSFRHDTAMRYLSSRDVERSVVRAFRNSLKDDGLDRLAAKAPNSVLNRLLERYKPTGNKLPSSNPAFYGKYVGVEIECILPYEGLGVESFEFLPDNGCDHDGDCECSADTYRMGRETEKRLIEKITSARIPGISVKHDGSIRFNEDAEVGLEVTCLFRVDDKAPLERLCALLNEVGARVNTSCGLHVHLDCRDLVDKRAVSNRAARLGHVLPILSKMMPESRRNNSYCQMAVSDYRGSRYYAVNKCAYDKFKTIEVRLHSGTTNYSKIANWVDLVFAISRATAIRERMADHFLMLDAINARDSMIAYVESRLSAFDPTFAEVRRGTDAEDAAHVTGAA
jgi:hypothetical protein